MSLEQMKVWLDAMRAVAGRTALVSVENKDNSLGAHMQFRGVLGAPEIGERRIWVPVLYAQDTEDDRTGFSVNIDHFESGGQLTPYQIRVIADGLAINVFPS